MACLLYVVLDSRNVFNTCSDKSCQATGVICGRLPRGAKTACGHREAGQTPNALSSPAEAQATYVVGLTQADEFEQAQDIRDRFGGRDNVD
jgi:hypothetical protein